MGQIASLFSYYFGSKEAGILMIGLDGAGKTTILYKLKLGEVVSTIPTLGFNVETVNYKNVTFKVWDVGGQHRIRALWSRYFEGTDGVIYVVDSNDVNRIEESKKELHSILSEPDLANSIVLIFANKQDLPNALSIAEITESLDMHNIPQKHWHVQSCCGLDGQGLYEGLDWFSNTLSNL